jgi:hypothetical protein
MCLDYNHFRFLLFILVLALTPVLVLVYMIRERLSGLCLFNTYSGAFCFFAGSQRF